jgi:hypothetical protein
MEPVSTVTAALGIAKSAGDISKKLYEFGKSLKDRDLKQQIDEILDEVRDLKHLASQLEDQNRELREKLRFKSDEYAFRSPFWYHKARPEQPLCSKCFANNIPAPMGKRGQDCNENYRRCLVCQQYLDVRGTSWYGD